MRDRGANLKVVGLTSDSSGEAKNTFFLSNRTLYNFQKSGRATSPSLSAVPLCVCVVCVCVCVCVCVSGGGGLWPAPPQNSPLV